MNETRIRVRYAETDQMGVVYHANHFIWFEVGRVELLRQLGFSYKDMEREDDCFIAVVDARCRYKAPVHYDDEVVVRTYLKHVREKVIHFGYELSKGGYGRVAGRRRDHAHRGQRKNEAPRAAGEIYERVSRRSGEIGTKGPMQEFLYKLQLVRKDMLRAGPTESEQAIVTEHFAYLQNLNAQGVIIFVGRTLNIDENAMGLAVFRAESEDAARRIMNDDPAVKKGVMTARCIRSKWSYRESGNSNREI